MQTLGKLFTANYLLTIALFSWLSAQIIKTFLNYYATKDFSVERLFGAGGMPSAHSALVCSIVIAAVRKFGINSPIFAICFILAAIVMYDAMGVRRSAGEQAKIINKIVSDLMEGNNENLLINGKKLKELVGHTPIEVLSGALLGIIIAMLFPIF